MALSVAALLVLFPGYPTKVLDSGAGSFWRRWMWMCFAVGLVCITAPSRYITAFAF